MKPANGANEAITRAMRRIERDECVTFREFRGGIVIKRTRPPRHTQVYHGAHEVDESMLWNRPKETP